MDLEIIRSLQGLSSEQEERALLKWRRSSEMNELRYQEIVRIWDVTELAKGFYVAPEVESGVSQSSSEADGARVKAFGGRLAGRRVIRAALLAAALILLAIGLGRLLTPDQRVQFHAAEFSTGAAEMATVRLNDGSVVRLAPNSLLRLDGEDPHALWLEGQAFFGVPKQDRRRLIVQMPVGSIVVLGTRFDLRVRDETLRLVVVDGRVTLNAADGALEVSGGEMGVVERGGQPNVIKVASVRSLLTWMETSLIFQETPLAQAAAEISERFQRPVRLDDQTLFEQTITAVFTDQEFVDVMSVVCRAVGATQCLISSDSAAILSRPALPAGS